MNKKLKQINPLLRPPKMRHIRQVKPEFFDHEGIAGLQPLTRLAFIGLWTCADKNGRFEWSPRYLKAKILPYDDVDFGEVLGELQAGGFIEKYSVNGEDYGHIINFSRHQVIQKHELESAFGYPEPQEVLNCA